MCKHPGAPTRMPLLRRCYIALLVLDPEGGVRIRVEKRRPKRSWQHLRSKRHEPTAPSIAPVPLAQVAIAARRRCPGLDTVEHRCEVI